MCRLGYVLHWTYWLGCNRSPYMEPSLKCKMFSNLFSRGSLLRLSVTLAWRPLAYWVAPLAQSKNVLCLHPITHAGFSYVNIDLFPTFFSLPSQPRHAHGLETLTYCPFSTNDCLAVGHPTIDGSTVRDVLPIFLLSAWKKESLSLYTISAQNERGLKRTDGGTDRKRRWHHHTRMKWSATRK